MASNNIIKGIILLTLVILSSSGYSQGVVGFFTQKQTQTQYLIQQIAALKVYAGYLKQGYKLVDGGLETIGKFKDGHFKLDKAFFDRLSSIHPKVVARAKAISNLYLAVKKEISQGRGFVRESERLENYEKQFAESVFNASQKTLNESYAELEQMLDGSYKMTDDERLGRVEKIYQKVYEQYGFLNKFSKDFQKLEIQKRKEVKDVSALKQMYQ